MHNRKIAVLGLGYVGLPVAVAFGKLAPTIGFDINSLRIQELRDLYDRTNEVSREDLQQSQLELTDQIQAIAKADFHIIAVPTPVDEAHQPNLSPVESASNFMGKALKIGDIVVYESTVYPGVTEDVCIPILEKVSGLKSGRDFFVGYSPERINPGDKEHTFTNILKIVSAQDEQTLNIIAKVYESVVTAGVFKAASIKIAEAAKILENTQRDVNIALMNELSMIFARMGIDTYSVIEAASSKWNFLRFKPGLVGGHCIGVDPYYLTHQAEKLGYHSQLILTGRRINDDMGAYIGQQIIKQLILAGHDVAKATVTILGITFKENCPDLRNSKVIDVIHELRSYGIQVQISDAHANPQETQKEYQTTLTPHAQLQKAQAIVIAVAHTEYYQLQAKDYLALLDDNPVVIDVKGICSQAEFKAAGIHLWRL